MLKMARTKGLHVRDTARLERKVDDLLNDYVKTFNLVLSILMNRHGGFVPELRNEVMAYVGL